LWAGHQELHGGKCKVNWAHVCRPLRHRGLGITDLERFAHALRVRWLWFQWKTLDKSWSNSELPVDDVDRALFAAATRVTVHNGKSAKFWTSSWVEGMAPATMFPDLFKHSRRKNRCVAEALENEIWIRDIMQGITLPLQAEYVML
jgi:hypothetical protein